MDFVELPEQIRVKLRRKDEHQLWEKVEKMKVKEAGKETGFSTSKIYNWKSKDSFLPVGFVRYFLKNIEKVEALKGGGRSQPIKDIDFPLSFNDELLTRVNCSVSVNKEGVPIYQTDDRGNAERFAKLLKKHGDLPFEVYSRDFYEIRYPKYIHQILERQQFSEDFAARVDERGYIENGYIGVEDKALEISDFEDELFSRSKRLSLALARQNSEEIAYLMAEESEEIRQLIR